jgi:hypothetical protein
VCILVTFTLCAQTKLVFLSIEQALTKLAVADGSRQVSEEKMRKEAAAADAIASQIQAEEEHVEKKQKKKKKSKKK